MADVFLYIFDKNEKKTFFRYIDEIHANANRDNMLSNKC